LPIIPDTAFTNGQYSCLKKHTEVALHTDEEGPMEH
jgi:hypothetical protein